MIYHTLKRLGITALLIFTLVCLMPIQKTMPVLGATPKDWHPHSFWYSPWGRSGTHKGIDIFAKAGTPVLAASSGIVIYTGFNDMGGNHIFILGSKWRFYYYAHLQHIQIKTGQWIKTGKQIGTVGNTGNAIGKPAHLHFTIRSIFPLFWQYEPTAPYAWLKMYYINPDNFLRS